MKDQGYRPLESSGGDSTSFRWGERVGGGRAALPATSAGAEMLELRGESKDLPQVRLQICRANLVSNLQQLNPVIHRKLDLDAGPELLTCEVAD